MSEGGVTIGHLTSSACPAAAGDTTSREDPVIRASGLSIDG
jgi:hypothetical protein